MVKLFLSKVKTTLSKQLRFLRQLRFSTNSKTAENRQGSSIKIAVGGSCRDFLGN